AVGMIEWTIIANGLIIALLISRANCEMIAALCSSLQNNDSNGFSAAFQCAEYTHSQNKLSKFQQYSGSQFCLIAFKAA
ncbi:hypothetical protein, partial [Kingella kingae]|uniref:hypothetical protein n=1 Tax=Kingella kingae TaxID=504 RepID=UPI001E442DC9